MSTQNALYICFQNDHCVRKYSNAGTLLTTYPQTASANFSPLICALDSQQNLYVINNTNDTITKFNPSGSSLQELGAQGPGNGQFNGLRGIVVTSQNRLLVIESINRRFQLLTTAGTFIAKYDLPNGMSPYLGIAQDSSSNAYVPDTISGRIIKFDKNFNAVDILPTEGLSGSSPILLSVTHPALFVSDITGHYTKINLNTSTIAATQSDASKVWSSGAQDSNGILWLTNYTGKTLEKYNQVHSTRQFAAQTTNTASTVSLSWVNPSDTDFQSSRLYRTNSQNTTTLLTQANIQSYTDTPPADGSYTYTLYALTAQGNPSTVNTTVATVQGNPPSPASGVQTQVRGNRITLTWTNPGNTNGFSGVTLQRDTTTYPSSVLVGITVTSNSTATTLTESLPNGTYYYSFFARDEFGNAATQATGNATVLEGAIMRDPPLNYPNPFKMSTGAVIGYWLNQNIGTELRIYTTTGSLAYQKSFRSGLDQGAKGGYNQIQLNASIFGFSWPSGVYPYFILANNQIIGRGKMAILPE